MAEANGSWTTKEIVLEIRDTVDKLADKLDRIDREGSIGTKAQLDDHEHRLRQTSELVQRLADQRVTREDVHNIRSDIAAINLAMAEGPELVRQFRNTQAEVESLSSWREGVQATEEKSYRISSRLLAWAAVVLAGVGNLVTFVWLQHG